MNLDKVKKFIQLAKEEGVSSLKYEEKDLKISVEIGGKVQAISQPMISAPTRSSEAVSALHLWEHSIHHLHLVHRSLFRLERKFQRVILFVS
jgi:hypothetical protein